MVQPLPLIRIAVIGGPFALISEALPLVRNPVALVGPSVALVGPSVALGAEIRARTIGRLQVTRLLGSVTSKLHAQRF